MQNELVLSTWFKNVVLICFAVIITEAVIMGAMARDAFPALEFVLAISLAALVGIRAKYFRQHGVFRKLTVRKAHFCLLLPFVLIFSRFWLLYFFKEQFSLTYSNRENLRDYVWIASSVSMAVMPFLLHFTSAGLHQQKFSQLDDSLRVFVMIVSIIVFFSLSFLLIAP